MTWYYTAMTPMLPQPNWALWLKARQGIDGLWIDETLVEFPWWLWASPPFYLQGCDKRTKRHVLQSVRQAGQQESKIQPAFQMNSLLLAQGRGNEWLLNVKLSLPVLHFHKTPYTYRSMRSGLKKRKRTKSPAVGVNAQKKSSLRYAFSKEKCW